jgi:S1-C subfamily serine protease
MNKDKIDKIFHDLSKITDSDKSPLIKSMDEVIYGLYKGDDRKDVYQLSNSNHEDMYRKLVNSTVILTTKNQINKNTSGSWDLYVNAFRHKGLPPCSQERFGNQKTGGFCSGFLVGKDVIITAGHCGKTEDDIQNTVYIFGFQATSETDTGTTSFHDNQVYFGKELIAHDLSDTGDFAIVRVDRPVTSPDAEALTFSTSDNPTIGSNLGVIGYPSGLPVKIAFGDETILIRDKDPWLISNLDTYGGNSGSAVFNNHGQVVGILVSGAKDYVLETDCFRSNLLKNSEGSEVITKALVFKNKIPND